MKKKDEYPIVEVQWMDIASEWGWEPLMEYMDKEPLPCSTVGYLIEGDMKKSDHVVLITSLGYWTGEFGGPIGRPGQGSGSTVIPRGVITKMRRLT